MCPDFGRQIIVILRSDRSGWGFWHFGGWTCRHLRYFTKGTMRIVRFMCDQRVGWEKWMVCKHLLAPCRCLPAPFNMFNLFCLNSCQFLSGLRHSKCIFGNPTKYKGPCNSKTLIKLYDTWICFLYRLVQCSYPLCIVLGLFGSSTLTFQSLSKSQRPPG